MSYTGLSAHDFDRTLLWHYRARLVRVYDGDTPVVECDCGFWGRHEVHVRLAGYNAAEKYKPGGKEATAALELALGAGVLATDSWPLRVVTLQREMVVEETRSFERYVGSVYVTRPNGNLVNVVELL